MRAKSAWRNMIARCHNPEHHRYKDYGARGIRVCDRWFSFELFLQDVGARPEGMTLNRVDNDGNYEPGNCAWATPREQAQNRRDNNNLTFNGETLCVAEWARRLGTTREALRNRVLRGWSAEDSLTTPFTGLKDIDAYKAMLAAAPTAQAEKEKAE